MLNFLVFSCLKLKGFFHFKKNTLVILMILFIFAFVLRMFVIPHLHNLYFDELAYLDTAKNIAEDSNNCLCLYNIDGECKFCGYSLKAVGFSFLLGLIFKVFGSSASLGFGMVAIFGSFSVILMFLFVYLLFEKEKLALLASSILTFYPLHLRWSGSVSVEIVSMFFILLSLSSLLIYLKKRGLLFFLNFVFITIFTIMLKEENLLLFPFVVLPFFFIKDFRKKALVIFVGFLILFIPYTISLISFHTSSDYSEKESRYTFWKAGSLLSWKFFKASFLDNLYFFVDWHYTSILVILFFLFGLVFLFRDYKKLFYLLLMALLSVPILFSAYIGETLDLSDVRHYILTLVPFVVFSAYGLYKGIKILNRKEFFYFFMILIAVSSTFYSSYLLSEDAPVLSPQEDYETILSGFSMIPSDCIVLSQESYIWDFHGKSAASFFIPGLVLDGCIYYYEGDLCYRFEANDECNKIRKNVLLRKIYSDGIHSYFKVESKKLVLDEIFSE